MDLKEELSLLEKALYRIVDAKEAADINSGKLELATIISKFKFDEIDVPIVTETFTQFSEDLNRYLDTVTTLEVRDSLKKQVLVSFGSLKLSLVLFFQKGL